jgi:hypothetical protein
MTRRILPAFAAIAMVVAAAAPVAAHEPDPLLGGSRWAKDQIVSFEWKAGQVPPSWATTPIIRAGSDSNRTRASRAAQFVYGTYPTSQIAYGEPTGCTPLGIACFSRTGAPISFRMWFRAQGFAFDWGRLRWCQALPALADGCFDVENVALDEFGHVQILDHHANLSDANYLDAVVQEVSKAFPKTGWDVHAYGRCDVARLQLEYERPGPGSLFSTCLKVGTTTTLAASATAIPTGGSVRFGATLRVQELSVNRELAGDLISGRPVLLQRRTPGATTWTTVATMIAGSTAGSYSTTIWPTATYEWRATFATPTNEGLAGSASTVVKVTVGS